MKLFWIICTVIFAVFVFFFIFGYICFFRACGRRNKYPADRLEYGGGEHLPEESLAALRKSREWFDGASFERVHTCSRDGLRLSGQILPSEGEARGNVIMLHGYHSSCRRDLSLQAQILHENGYNLLLVDQRSHGESEGRYICFGALERFDVAIWCELMNGRFGTLPTALFGLSMGASTAMMAAGSVSLPENVRCVIADCGFTSPWEIIKNTLRYRHKIMPYPVIYFMNYWSKALAGFDYREISTLDTLKASRLPVLIFHGERDRFVPEVMSRQMHAASPENTTLVRVPEARHTQAIFFDLEGYKNKTLSFLDEKLR